MKTLTLTLIKKNRMYFAAKNEAGYDCKVKITPESENIELGEHTLLVDDLSVRSKYGTDLIYAVKSDIKESGIVSLKHFAYNSWLVAQCRKLGGKWDADQKAWIFSSIVGDKVDELDVRWNEKITTVEITAKKDLTAGKDSVEFCGYPIARATGRDSGAHLTDGVSLIQGMITSSGSMKNWNTFVKAGTVFRLKITDVYAFADADDEEWSCVEMSDA